MINTVENPNCINILLGTCGFSVGDKCQVFDGEKWMKTGDIGNNECYWVNATITGFRQTDYKELLIDVNLMQQTSSGVMSIDGEPNVSWWLS